MTRFMSTTVLAPLGPRKIPGDASPSTFSWIASDEEAILQ